jgi:hypothetical protein
MINPEDSSTISHTSKTADRDTATEPEFYPPGQSLFQIPTFVQKTEPISASTVNYSVSVESSTSRRGDLSSIVEYINDLFISARDQIFEDGMESEYSRELARFISSYGHLGMEIIIQLILSEQVNPEVISEAMIVIGRIDDSNTYRDRLWLLERGLYNPSALVRDGATLGFASLDDPIAISPLKYAIEREQVSELRRDMEQVLSQLEDTRKNVSDKKNQKE